MFFFIYNCTSTMIVLIRVHVFYDFQVFSIVYHFVMLCMNVYNRWRIFHSTCTLQLSTGDCHFKRVSQDQLQYLIRGIVVKRENTLLKHLKPPLSAPPPTSLGIKSNPYSANRLHCSFLLKLSISWKQLILIFKSEYIFHHVYGTHPSCYCLPFLSVSQRW